MNPKSGKAGTAVAPAAPGEAMDADVADPGKAAAAKAAQRSSKTGKYGAAPATPRKDTGDEDDKPKKSWIEIELVDEEGMPVAGEAYEITVPDGTVEKGTLDGKGFARVDGIDPGTCKITFPKLDKDAWKKA
jgi:hypothetical protein